MKEITILATDGEDLKIKNLACLMDTNVAQEWIAAMECIAEWLV